MKQQVCVLLLFLTDLQKNHRTDDEHNETDGNDRFQLHTVSLLPFFQLVLPVKRVRGGQTDVPSVKRTDFPLGVAFIWPHSAS